VLKFSIREVSSWKKANAAITVEQTARVNADNALAQQIQNITAGNYTGAKTYRQDTQPANPGVGDIWLKPVAGKSDEMRRYSGSAWELIPLAEAPDLTAINARITAEETARASADSALASRTSTLETNYTAVNNKDDANAAGLSQANARIATEEQTRTSQFQSLAARTTGVETSVNGLNAKVSTNETSINGILAKYHIKVDANGRVAGIELLSGAGGSEFNVLVDAFRVFNPATGANEPVFEIRDGGVFIKQAFVGSIQVDGVTIDTNDQGALTIKQHGVTTNLLAQNAAVRPYTFFAQGNWVIPTKNAWLTAQIGGQTAQMAVSNPGDGGGFFEIVAIILATNGGSDSDNMGFRIKRSDGVYLPQQYTNVHVDGRGSANQPTTLHFFDEGVPAGAQLTYTLEAISNDNSPVRSITLLGKMFKNASSLPAARM
jgi:hypothetical protein